MVLFKFWSIRVIQVFLKHNLLPISEVSTVVSVETIHTAFEQYFVVLELVSHGSKCDPSCSDVVGIEWPKFF